jgi:MFS family permease
MSPKASGCSVTADDVPSVLSSISIYFANFGYGCGISIIGASILDMSVALGVPVTSFGIIFTFKGLGYLAGTLCSGFFVDLFSIPKPMMIGFAVLFSGLALLLIGSTASFGDIKYYSFAMGYGFALIDSLSTLSLSEMWGSRMAPWIQSKGMTLSIGAVVGPLLVSLWGYKQGYVIACVLCSLCLVSTFVGNLYNAFISWSRNVATNVDNIANTYESISAEHSLDNELEEGDAHSLLPRLNSIRVIPLNFKVAVGLIFYFYYGLYYAFGGWITSYSMAAGECFTDLIHLYDRPSDVGHLPVIP